MLPLHVRSLDPILDRQLANIPLLQVSVKRLPLNPRTITFYYTA